MAWWVVGAGGFHHALLAKREGASGAANQFLFNKWELEKEEMLGAMVAALSGLMTGDDFWCGAMLERSAVNSHAVVL